MPTFHIELTKHIVVDIEADDEGTARALATDSDLNTDGAWERAEAQIVEVLGKDD
jgi:hypothetical protein